MAMTLRSKKDISLFSNFQKNDICYILTLNCVVHVFVFILLSAGEVVSIAQLASLAGRPVSSCQGSKPVTFQLQGNKLTLSGAPIHQVSAASARPVQS